MTCGLSGCRDAQSSAPASGASETASSTAETSAAVDDAPDYSQKTCWYQIPDITKDVDTFFIYPTEYLATNEDDPDYA